KDMAECQAWAKNQGGTTALPAQAPQGPQGERAKGAARGAAVGAVAGAAGGDAGKGAAAGAAAGVVAGGVKQRKAARQQAETQQQQAQAAATNLDKAVGACMEGRGYTGKGRRRERNAQPIYRAITPRRTTTPAPCCGRCRPVWLIVAPGGIRWLSEPASPRVGERRRGALRHPRMQPTIPAVAPPICTWWGC